MPSYAEDPSNTPKAPFDNIDEDLEPLTTETKSPTEETTVVPPLESSDEKVVAPRSQFSDFTEGPSTSYIPIEAEVLAPHMVYAALRLSDIAPPETIMRIATRHMPMSSIFASARLDPGVIIKLDVNDASNHTLLNKAHRTSNNPDIFTDDILTSPSAFQGVRVRKMFTEAKGDLASSYWSDVRSSAKQHLHEDHDITVVMSEMLAYAHLTGITLLEESDKDTNTVSLMSQLAELSYRDYHGYKGTEYLVHATGYHRYVNWKAGETPRNNILFPSKHHYFVGRGYKVVRVTTRKQIRSDQKRTTFNNSRKSRTKFPLEVASGLFSCLVDFLDAGALPVYFKSNPRDHLLFQNTGVLDVTRKHDGSFSYYREWRHLFPQARTPQHTPGSWLREPIIPNAESLLGKLDIGTTQERKTLLSDRQSINEGTLDAMRKHGTSNPANRIDNLLRIFNTIGNKPFVNPYNPNRELTIFDVMHGRGHTPKEVKHFERILRRTRGDIPGTMNYPSCRDYLLGALLPRAEKITEEKHGLFAYQWAQGVIKRIGQCGYKDQTLQSRNDSTSFINNLKYMRLNGPASSLPWKTRPGEKKRAVLIDKRFAIALAPYARPMAKALDCPQVVHFARFVCKHAEVSHNI